MNLFSRGPFTWSDEIKWSDNTPPYYRCFNKNGRLCGHVRNDGHKTAPMYDATIRIESESHEKDRDIGTFNTIENAKSAVEKAEIL